MRLLFTILVCVVCTQARAELLFKVHQDPIAIYHLSDIHAGSGSAASGTDSNLFWNLTQSILDSNQAWGGKVVLLHGDCYEQTGDGPLATLRGSNLPPLLKMLQTNGLSIQPCKGNHDSDSVTAIVPYFFTNQFPVSWFTNDPAYGGTMTPNDTSAMLFFVTNGSTKMLFVTIPFLGPQNGQATDAETIALHQPYVTWAVSNINHFSNHIAWVETHSMVDHLGDLSFSQINTSPDYLHMGPGPAAWTNALSGCRNLAGIFTGHERTVPLTTTLLLSDHGHTVPLFKFNTQSARQFGYSTNGATLQLIQILPGEARGRARTWDGTARRFLDDGEWGVNHNFYFPIRMFP